MCGNCSKLLLDKVFPGYPQSVSNLFELIAIPVENNARNNLTRKLGNQSIEKVP